MKQKVLFLMLLLLLGLAGGSVMAGEPVVERQAGMKIKPGNGIRPARLDRKELARQKGMRLDGKELDRMEKMPLKEASAGMKQRKGAPKRQAPAFIKEQPEGDLTTYWRSGGCIGSFSWGINTYEQKDKLNVVINGTDAYIKNPSWYFNDYSNNNIWVKGTYDATKGVISIPTGQLVYYDEFFEYGIQMMWGSTSGYKNEGSESYSLEGTLDENVKEICFQINEEAGTITLLDSEGNLKANLPDKYNATGIYLMYDDDQSFAAIEFNTKGEVFHAVPAVPANPTADDWYDKGDESGYSRFYFTLPTTDVDRNLIDPEKLSYSIYTDDDQIFTFDAAHYTYDLDEDITEVPYSIYKGNYDFQSDGVYFYRTNKGDNPLFTNRIGIQVHYTVAGVKNSSDIVYWYLPESVPAVPENPTADSWEDNGNEDGYNRFGFTLPTKDVDENPIDPSKLSYSIYTDNDQIFTFDAETYSFDLTEDMTEIPYSIYKNIDRYDFYENAVYFYRTNEGDNPLFTKRIGIQVHYTVDGVKNSSEIVYWYLPGVPANPTGVKWYETPNQYGKSRLDFTLPTQDMNGNELNKENLSYSIYTDEDQIFTFEYNEYNYELYSDQTEIPYSIYGEGADRVNFFPTGVYFHRTNEGDNPLFTKRIGIQVHNTVDGVKKSSEIVYWDLPTGPVPANPTADEWYDCGDETGFSRFYFTLPTEDTDGNALDPEKLSYSIYVDGELFTFPSIDYTYDLTEDITEVPYDLYSNAVDFNNYYVYFYRTNADGYEPLFTYDIGIQVHYTVNGVKNSSEIVYLYDAPAPAVAVNFVNNKDNSDLVTENADKKADATIEGRTIFAGGKWNTLCLPFDLTTEQLESSPLAEFEVKELDTEASESYTHITGYEADTKTLWLNFKDAEEIEAGKPYLVKFPETMDASKLGYEAIDGTAGFDNEGYDNLVDGSINTKWCSNKEKDGYVDGWICEFKAVAPASVTGYVLTTGGDTGNGQNWTRNPQKWTLEAKEKESDDWTLIDSRDVTAETGNPDDALPAANTEQKIYGIAAAKQGTYQYFRFKVSETGGNLMQLSELTLQGTYTPIDITNPVFKSVIIKDISPIEVTSEDKTVTFVGTYAPVVYEEENKSVLFLQGEKLYYPDGVKPTTINSFRAYFQLDGIYGGTPEEASGVHNFVLNFGDGETTGIATTKLTNQNVDWYSIDGRKLNQKPQQRGIYISNGRKVMVK